MSWLLEKLRALFRHIGKADAAIDQMAALRKALERQIESDEARDG